MQFLFNFYNFYLINHLYHFHLAKILSAFLNGLIDRNASVRKNNAVSIGHIVGSAKDSSLDKLFNTLNTWYLEREGTFKLTIFFILIILYNLIL